MITASHNPKEYNGYKAYWEDGSQLVPPHDKNVIAEVKKISKVNDVRFEGKPENIEILGDEVDKAYIQKVKSLSLSPESVRNQSNLKIVFTPLHGTGGTMVPTALEEFGFENIYLVREQAIADGNFPTVKSPNPEEPVALELALKQAKEVEADLVMATDPDADRVGIAVRDLENNFILLNGNQTAALLLYYLLTMWKQKDLFTGKEYIVKTIVTSEILKDIATSYSVECYDVLTGFKWIADLIRKLEKEKVYIGGGEESYGYMIGDFVRDKDAVSSCALIAETAAWAAENGKSLYELLIDIYLKYGFYKESLVSITKKGKTGSEEIREMMANFRENPPKAINNSPVTLIKDYQESIIKDLKSGTQAAIDLPKSNVLQFFLEDGSKISMRPSGTEPKIKFYFGVKEDINSSEEFMEKNEELENRIKAIIENLNL
jgi:phosphoglucomutase